MCSENETLPFLIDFVEGNFVKHDWGDPNQEHSGQQSIFQ